MINLKNKTALITGASSGIGRSTAILMAQLGANLVLGARREALLDTLVSEIQTIGGQAVALSGDVCNELYSKQLVELAQTKYGQLDIAFNNAGILGEMGNIETISSQGWNDTLQTNLTSAWYGAKHQIPAMEKAGGGSILFTSTFVGHTAGMPGMSAYGASKAGLIGMMRCLATECAGRNIRINALLPGGTDTAMGRSVADSPEMLAFVEGLHALKRIADPLEIARAAVFLSSDAASFITGTSMLVDGGISINKT